jgi:hypothetical protein
LSAYLTRRRSFAELLFGECGAIGLTACEAPYDGWCERIAGVGQRKEAQNGVVPELA